MSIGVVLLVSQDASTIEQISGALRQLSLVTDICSDRTTALRRLDRRKCDAVIVDFQLGSDAAVVLDEAR